jgi:hypothetical protein
MRRAGSALRIALYVAAAFGLYVWWELRRIERATSTKFHSNGRRYEQHRPTSNP